MITVAGREAVVSITTTIRYYFFKRYYGKAGLAVSYFLPQSSKN